MQNLAGCDILCKRGSKIANNISKTLVTVAHTRIQCMGFCGILPLEKNICLRCINGPFSRLLGGKNLIMA